MEGKTQQTSAAMAGMSVRSAHKWQRGPLPSETGLVADLSLDKDILKEALRGNS